MRFFSLLNNQHVFLYIFPTLVFMVLLGLALGYTHFSQKNSEDRMIRIHRKYPEEIEERDAPFPLMLILIIVGTFIWGLCYILGHGLMGVKI